MHIAAPRAVHVVGLDEALVVQVDVGVSVQPLEYDGLVDGSEFLGRRREVRLVHPIFLVHPLDRAFVEAEEGVVDDALAHEVEMRVAGYLGRMPYLGVALTEAPAVVQRTLRGGAGSTAADGRDECQDSEALVQVSHIDEYYLNSQKQDLRYKSRQTPSAAKIYVLHFLQQMMQKR